MDLGRDQTRPLASLWAFWTQCRSTSLMKVISRPDSTGFDSLVGASGASNQASAVQHCRLWMPNVHNKRISFLDPSLLIEDSVKLKQIRLGCTEASRFRKKARAQEPCASFSIPA